MVVEMQKLNLVAMQYDRDAILNALQETNAVEVKTHSEAQDTCVLPVEGEELRQYCSSLEAALSLLCAEADSYAKEHKLPLNAPKDGFEITAEEFKNGAALQDRMNELVANVNREIDARNEAKADLIKIERELKNAELYASCVLPFSYFADSAHTIVRLGVVPSSRFAELQAQMGELADFCVLSQNAEGTLVCFAAHKSEQESALSMLAGLGFAPCPYEGDGTGEELYVRLLQQKEQTLHAIYEREKAVYDLGAQARELKIYCDYIGFQLEKAELSEKLRGTQRTFLLEAYVPSGSEELVEKALSSVSGAMWFAFSKPEKGEVPPTLLHNRPVVENFEAITNMYSSPTYREFDPNAVMAFFYSLFLGFIMADIGYGILMLLGGGYLWRKNRRKGGGLKSLSGVFAVGGVFAIAWGLLFNSLFGIALPMPTVIPNAQTGMWTFIGISIPAVLIIAMMIGVLHLFTGYVCKMVECIRWGRLLDGIFDGGTWAVFSIGVEIALVGLVKEANLPNLTMIGGAIAAVGLFVAMITAGRRERFIGKFTKGFGAVYGIINYVSDILSYARLYGLMLSGAVIAQIVSQYAVQFITSGGAIAVLGVLLMIVGHAFNLAIGLLGAYIHDARLQYVEFYGRFYEGDGELFSPLGSKHKYVWIEPKKLPPYRKQSKADLKEAA